MDKIFRLTVFGLIIIALIVSFHYLGWLKPAESVLLKIISPIQRGAYTSALGVRSFYDAWLTKKNLLAENEILKDQLKTKQVSQSQINSLKEENELLKKELNFLRDNDFNFVATKIVSGVSDPISKSVIINRGLEDGVRKGLAVVADEGVLIGKIIEVYSNFSKVLLLTDNTSLVAATIQNQSKTAGLVEGQFGLSFTMTNIPQDQEINEGDLVVTSGLEGDIPKNLLIARVESVQHIESEIFKTATLGSIIPFDSLSYLAVIIP